MDIDLERRIARIDRGEGEINKHACMQQSSNGALNLAEEGVNWIETNLVLAGCMAMISPYLYFRTHSYGSKRKAARWQKVNKAAVSSLSLSLSLSLMEERAWEG
jgi:hypothetical protein